MREMYVKKTDVILAILLLAAVCVFYINAPRVQINETTRYGFAVDSIGQVYVGKKEKIEVYCNGNLVRTIHPGTNRGYAFTIQKDQTILLAAGGMVDVLDLEGKLLDSWEDEGTQQLNALLWNWEYSTENGDTYTLRNIAGYEWIEKNNQEVVYSLSVTDYMRTVAFCLSIVYILLAVLYFLIRWRSSQ